MTGIFKTCLGLHFKRKSESYKCYFLLIVRLIFVPGCNFDES